MKNFSIHPKKRRDFSVHLYARHGLGVREIFMLNSILAYTLKRNEILTEAILCVAYRCTYTSIHLYVPYTITPYIMVYGVRKAKTAYTCTRYPEGLFQNDKYCPKSINSLFFDYRTSFKCVVPKLCPKI